MDIATKAAPVIEMRPLSWFIHYARNPRKNDAAVDRMAASIREFGFKIPVLAKSNGSVVDGHLRLKAAAKLGIAEVPVILCDEWTDAQVKAFRLMVNRSVAWAEWDPELLGLEIADLSELSFDLSLTGFDPRELDELLAHNKGNAAEDEALEPPAVPVSKPGDLWLCAEHRVLCGDSTDSIAVSRLLGGQKAPFLMATDPPYGVDLEPEWRQESGLQDHTRQSGKVRNDDRADWGEAYSHFPGDVAYVWHASLRSIEVGTSILAAGFQIRGVIIWAKQALQISRGHYHWQHEPCWYAVRKGRTSHWCGDRKQSTLWSVANLNGNGNREETPTGHGTQKPVELFRRPILNHTERGDAVFDPFLGSGTTVIAAELTGRICYGLEISEAYTDVIVQRWQKQTGKYATLDGDGRTFDAIAEERLAVAA